MIRATLPEDTPALISATESTGLFSPQDIEVLHEVLDDYPSVADSAGHRAIAYEQDGKVIGFAYYAPEEMTDGTWYLWWIVVRKDVQARGVGGKLLRHAEEDMVRMGGRLLVLMTSSLPSYELTRRFYGKNGFEQAALIKDFYADGHHQVTFTKRLKPRSA